MTVLEQMMEGSWGTAVMASVAERDAMQGLSNKKRERKKPPRFNRFRIPEHKSSKSFQLENQIDTLASILLLGPFS